MSKIERKGTVSAGGASNAFSTIQPDAGTSPVASSATDTLTLTSSDNSITITGDSTTDTIDFVVASSGVTDHGALTGLTDDDHTQYVAKDGRAGGQTVKGGTAASENLILESTANATKGIVKVSGLLTVGSTSITNTGTLGATGIGSGHAISGESNFGVGYSHTVDGNWAFAGGYICASRGTASFAFGRQTTAQGHYSFAMGRALYTPPASAQGSHFLGDSDPDTLGEQTCPTADALVGRFKNGFELYRGNMSGVSYQLKQSTLSTTDATQSTLQSISTASNKSYMIEARVTARRTGGSGGAAGDSAVYIIRAMAKNVAGTLTVSGVTAEFTQEDQAGWDATIDGSGTTIRVRVTGAANNNVTWNSTVVVDVV